MPETEFNKLLNAIYIIGNMVYKYPDGYVKNGIAHKDVVLMYEPEEINGALQIIQNYLFTT